MKVAPEDPWAWEARRRGGRGVRALPARGGRLRRRAQGDPAPSRLGRTQSSSSRPARAADDDAVLLDGDLDGPMAGPVLGVDRVVLDRRVEPQAVALLAVVEGALERARCRRRARSEHPAPATAAATARARRRASSSSSARSPSCAAFASASAFARSASSLGGLELGGDQRVVLGAQVDLLADSPTRSWPPRLLLDQLVLALELFDVAHADLELVGHPGVGTALAYPGADLVEVADAVIYEASTARETSAWLPRRVA